MYALPAIRAHEYDRPVTRRKGRGPQNRWSALLALLNPSGWPGSLETDPQQQFKEIRTNCPRVVNLNQDLLDLQSRCTISLQLLGARFSNMNPFPKEKLECLTKSRRGMLCSSNPEGPR